MGKSKDDPEAVQAYLEGLPGEEKQTLEKLRSLVRRLVPDAQERISYGGVVIVATRYDLVGFGSQKNHLSFFVMSPPLAAEMKEEITKTHKVSGATIHFSPDSPLPEALVRKIVKARVAQNSAR